MHQALENQKSKRAHFSLEEDQFLTYIYNSTNIQKKLVFWKLIHEMFNRQFPLKKKTRHQIKYHVQNVLEIYSHKGEFEYHEKERFYFLRIIQKLSLSKIAREMKRSHQSVKNYYYREFQKDIQKDSDNTLNIELESKMLKSIEEDISFLNILIKDETSWMK
jgi:hypothetical protein